jgi:hypothetical protein
MTRCVCRGWKVVEFLFQSPDRDGAEPLGMSTLLNWARTSLALDLLGTSSMIWHLLFNQDFFLFHVFFLFFLTVLGFELRTLHLLGTHYLLSHAPSPLFFFFSFWYWDLAQDLVTPMPAPYHWSNIPSPFLLHFDTGFTKLPRLASNFSYCLRLLRSWD